MNSSCFDELKAIIQSDPHNRYIYQSISTLIGCKNQEIQEISQYEQLEESVLFSPLEESHPDPLFLFTNGLDRLSLLCRILSFKLCMKYRIADAVAVSKYDLQNGCTIVLEKIKKNPKITYWEIVGVNNTSRNELALEYLIETRQIARVGAKNNTANKDYSYWKSV